MFAKFSFISRLRRTVNTTYIYGGIPLRNVLIAILFVMAISRLMSRFDYYYETRPLLTMMVTNSILGGVADTTAQTLTSIRQRALRQPGGAKSNDKLVIEMHELDEKDSLPRYTKELIPESLDLPPPFDYERLTRFMAWGFLIAPIQYKWFQWLSKAFPIGSTNGTVQTLKRVAVDQAFFAPAGLGLFLSYLTITEGGGRRAVAQKMNHIYIPTLKTNYLVWPAVQLLNFRVVPLQFQLPFVSTVGIAWTAYISLSNAAADVKR